MPFSIPVLPAVHWDLPEPLKPLKDLSYNFWWAWNRQARQLFRRVDPDLWVRYRNPIRLLQLTHNTRLDSLAEDDDFLTEMQRVSQNFKEASLPTGLPPKVAYISAEYGLHESLPIYSGGLGVLAGDHLKGASDLGLPLIAVGLYYRRGYFRQVVDANGNQQHHFPALDAYRLPLLRVANQEGSSLRVPIQMDDREVTVRVWATFVGKIPLLLLDSHNQSNEPEDRFITSQLYVDGRELRLEQEVLLGRGAVAVLDALEATPTLWHLNEGHTAFAALEHLGGEKKGDLEAAISAAREHHVFTTHTTVPAGNESFEESTVLPYLASLSERMEVAPEEILNLGKAENGEGGFNLTAVALNLSHKANGVSALHAEVSGQMWPRHTIDPITNGVHLPTWMGREVAKVLQAEDGSEPGVLAARAAELPDETLWAAHTAQKHRLMRFVRVRALTQFARHGHAPNVLRRISNLLNPQALTIGFARRFAPYKRSDLLFHDTQRLARLLSNEDCPVQLILSGKAHPADRGGQEAIRSLWEIARQEDFLGRIVFIEDYDMAVSRLLVGGSDCWLNTPEWPREASGTSGMKAVINGALHASVPDGWWAEAASDDVGFTLGEAAPPDQERDAKILFDTLDQRVVPLYFQRNEAGLPVEWIATMRRSMASFLERFSARRMVRDYQEHYYGSA